MRKIILAAFAVLSLTGAAFADCNAYTTGGCSSSGGTHCTSYTDSSGRTHTDCN